MNPMKSQMDWFFLVTTCLLMLWCLTGCSGSSLSIAQQASVFQLDLSGTLDGVDWQGIAVGSQAITHDIKIQSKTDVNYMRILSCHRFEQYEDVIKTGWFKANRGFEYTYNESPGIEDTGLCVLRLQAFTKQVASDGNPVGSAFGLMLFHNAQFSLPGENICNGADGITAGTSICQSMSGLVERLKFKTQVIASNPSQDPNMPKPCSGKFIDATTWEYTMPVGECMAVFASTSKPHQYYVHMAYGFNKTQYRGE